MERDEQTEHDADDDDGVELPADEPGVPDEPGPSDDEQEAEAEADEQDAEPEPEPEARGASEADWEKRNREAEKRFATYQRALERIYQDDFGQLANCPLCLGPTPGFVVIGAAGRVPQEQADLVKHFLGLARPIDLQPDPETETCRTCDGEGQTLTGSKVPSQRERTCPTCVGYGYTPPPTLAQNGHAPEGVAPPPLSVASPDIVQGDLDDWKQPRKLPDGRDNPNYGKMPSYWINVHPWGDTRELTAQDAVPAGGS